MLTKTQITVDPSLLEEALKQLPEIDFRHTINRPTGNFFYDPWVIKDEYKDTVWAKLIEQLPNIGEARIIVLNYGNCYQAHSDIDDRYHLTLHTDNSYLIDLDNNEMHKLSNDGIWYDMDASRIHSAANFGYDNRTQLVVRQLLKQNALTDPINVTIKFAGKQIETARFKFDNIVSKWLNINNKLGAVSNFNPTETTVNFDIEQSKLNTLQSILTDEFIIEHD